MVRALAVPEHVGVVAIGGATLGGSGKTPLSLACTRFLASLTTERIALIGHAYRASPVFARAVSPYDALDAVGDEAILCARALADVPHAETIVAPSRQRAIDFAASRGARILVLDGISQIAPRRADLALLALDGHAPWGNGACPPRGDLRAPPSALLGASDEAVVLSDEMVHMASAVAMYALSGQPERISLQRLARMKVGLLTALARPRRVARALEARGIALRVQIHASDHGTPSERELVRAAAAHGLEAWVTTPKCAIHVVDSFAKSLMVPMYVLEHHVALNAPIRRALLEVLDRRGLVVRAPALKALEIGSRP